MSESLSKFVVQQLITEGFKPYPKTDPRVLYCNSKAWSRITGYRERNNDLTNEFISATQPSLPKMNYSYQKALHTVIYKARISVLNGRVYFTQKDEEPLEGLEAELAYRGKNDFIGVEKTLLKHISALERQQRKSRGGTPRKKEQDTHV